MIYIVAIGVLEKGANWFYAVSALVASWTTVGAPWLDCVVIVLLYSSDEEVK